MEKPETPFPRHWLYYIVLKYGVLIAAVPVPELTMATPRATIQMMTLYEPKPAGSRCLAMMIEITMPSTYSV